MAWRAVGKSNTDLINQLETYKFVKTQKVKEIMLETDRKFYAPRNPYVDGSQSIKHGSFINAPHMHATILELLLEKFERGGRALDVGCGSGYLTACLARANRKALQTDNTAQKIVIGIEQDPALVDLAFKSIGADSQCLLCANEIDIIEGDGRFGYEKFAPYDIINVGAAALETPQHLLQQLSNCGRMLCPIGSQDGIQYLEQYDKDALGNVSRTKLMRVLFVPLTDSDGEPV